MKKLAFIILLVLVFCGGIFAQADCPTISVTGPSGVPSPGEPISFTVTVEPASKDLKYEWSVSSGKILEGQGTTAIKVEPEKGGGVNLTTTVEITGLPAECPKIASETGGWCPRLPQAELIESFRGPITAKDRSRFENIDKILQNDPDASYIFFLAGSVRQIKANKEAILKYLHTRDIDPPRITFVDLADNAKVTEFWRVPPGAATPSISADGMTIRP